MFCQVINLKKYFTETQVYFNFFDGLFLLENENKQQIFDKLQIPSSTYRTQRLKEKKRKSANKSEHKAPAKMKPVQQNA